MTKAESVRLYSIGAFGNHARQWVTWEDFCKDGEGRRACKSFALRGRWPQGVFVGPLKSRGAVLRELSQPIWLLQREMSSFYVSEMVDNRLCVLNAEVMRGVGGLDLHYATTPQTMRDGLRDAPQHAHGLKAKMILEHFCCTRGRDAVYELLDEYPDHIVEFAVFNHAVGLLGWHTVIWEVRDY